MFTTFYLLAAARISDIYYVLIYVVMLQVPLRSVPRTQAVWHQGAKTEPFLGKLFRDQENGKLLENTYTTSSGACLILP